MALFRKKKKDNTQKVSSDFNPLDSIISHLKTQKPDITDGELVEVFKDLAAPADDLEHLDEEGELPWGWHTTTKDFTEKTKVEYSLLLKTWWDAKDSGNPIAEHEALQPLIAYMDGIKKLCESKDECFAFWCNNILIGEGVIERRKEELKNLELNMNTKIQEYEARQKAETFKKTLTDEMIISVLKQNSDIAQKDFYKLYDPDFKSALSEKLYFMAKEGKIERVKAGNSYILKIK